MTIILYRQFSSFLGEASSSLEDHNFGSDIADACLIRSHWHGSAPATTLRDNTVILSLDSAVLQQGHL